MFAIALSAVLVADPPAEKKPAPPGNPVATALVALKFGERTTFIGRPMVHDQHVQRLVYAAVAEVLAKDRLPADSKRLEVRPIFTQGDPEAPHRMVLELKSEAEASGDPEKFLKAVCAELEQLLGRATRQIEILKKASTLPDAASTRDER